MITIEGKIVFTELAELVDPAHTALIVVDMQRDFIEPDGVFGKLGIDLSMYTESRPKLAALLTAADAERNFTLPSASAIKMPPLCAPLGTLGLHLSAVTPRFEGTKSAPAYLPAELNRSVPARTGAQSNAAELPK